MRTEDGVFHRPWPAAAQLPLKVKSEKVLYEEELAVSFPQGVSRVNLCAEPAEASGRADEQPASASRLRVAPDADTRASDYSPPSRHACCSMSAHSVQVRLHSGRVGVP